LSGEGLGRGDADLGPGVGEQDEVGLPHQGAFRDVADRQGRGVAQALGQPQRGQGVGGLPGLGDGDEEGLIRCRVAAIAVFTRHLDLTGKGGGRFDPVSRHQAGMVAGTAGDDLDRADGLENVRGLLTEGLG
jgi:hypothetical protein